MQLHYGRFGQFKALSNQPGVEFHIKLTKACPLGDSPQWFGWQCKFHRRTSSGDLTSASRKDIESSLRTTENSLPGITDWILWTPYTLSKNDQDWFYALHTKMKLTLWAEEELDTHLNGDGLLLRSTYFGELIITPRNLEEQHRVAVQPIRERWLEPVHQPVDAERTIRRMLGEPGSWEQLIAVGERLSKAIDAMSLNKDGAATELKKMIEPFVTACSAFADTLLRFHEILASGDLEVILQKLSERKTLIGMDVKSMPRRLRTLSLSISLDATNALSDMRIAQELLNEAEEFLGVGLVALLADAGGGKTQLAAQLTAPQEGRPAGVLLRGCDLHRGQTLDDLVHHFSISGNPLTSMTKLLASLDSAGKRAGCRLPVLIDGLNEAENPKDWKSALAELNEIVKRYPNVLVVCTLRTGERRRDTQAWRQESQANDRESFAVMSLPSDVKKIESEGFGGDVDDAIEKYFNHFKINPGDAEVPVDLLQHPLTLRIFCQVTNPKRESEVNIDYFPASLAPLFEKYIFNACERISQLSNLSYSYSVDDVQLAVYKLGIQLWEGKHRETIEKSYRETVSDTTRSWDSSIVNLLAQEGIIFRNPGVEPGEYAITTTYDALGGYIIADSLLKKNIQDITFEWLKEPEAIASFMGENSHKLARDIFVALVTLAPRRIHGKQIWKEIPNTLKNAALLFTTNLEAAYLDQDTVAALLTLFKKKPKTGSHPFFLLQGIRCAVNHPLNAKFLDIALREMSISERDLNWTEWIRETRTERFNDLLAIELRWKENLATRTPSDRLRAIWLMWLLTSTDRELRDFATRALYWFGRGDPSALFEESIRSLQINDPYVSERMLAACYGVAMARHVDIQDDTFRKTILPRYARSIYNAVFAEDAPFGTTHLLMREYETRIIELAMLHNPGLFTDEEVKRTRPPFSDGGLRVWGESKNSKGELHGHDTPFRMDFENYTLGRLVPGRGNYNYEHEGYRKVRAQILWRIEQLGWSCELFKDVESIIERKHYGPRIGNDGKKVDRYGKKYSWIAYFEMSGFLHDQRTLEDWKGRTSSVDIDPSFPKRVATMHLIQEDLLGDPEMAMKEWIANGPPPNLNPYLRLEKLQEEIGPWITLDGYISQQDKKRGRQLFCFIRSFLVDKKNAASFLDHLSKQDLGGRWLPEKPEVIYTFAGEIPWCDTYPQNGLSEFLFLTGEKTIKVQRTQQKLYLDGKKLEFTQIDLVRLRLFGDTIGELKEKQLSGKDIERIETRDVSIEVDEIEKEYAKFKVLIPVCDFGWESYHTDASNAGHATMLSKEISYDLELIGQPQTFDLFTRHGVKATFNISDHGNDYGNNQSMFFMREDLLKMYLERNDLILIWAIWGEREYSNDQIEKLFHGSNRPEQPYAVYGYVKQYE